MADILIKIPDEIVSFVNINGFIPSKYIRDVSKALLESTPLPKGHWLGDSAGYKCDKCGHDLLEIAHSIDYIDFKKPKYCPNCGAKMD